jgi:hypothetical protein
MSIRPVLLATLAVISAGSAIAHEFWVDPEAYSVAKGQPIVAHTRIGQEFEGASFSYLPQNFRRYDLLQGGTLAPITSRMGDRPSFNQPAPGEGLAVIASVTGDFKLVYDSAEMFRDFVTHKDFEWALEVHAERGHPETGFGEAYSRYAKSLVGVGHSEGSDSRLGLLTEIVALANPYTDDLADGLPVQVFYDDAPRGDVQVELFEKSADGTVDITLHRTDDQGVARLPVRPGYVYMVDSVVMRDPPPDKAEEMGVVWESLWANLTFAVPAR